MLRDLEQHPEQLPLLPVVLTSSFQDQTILIETNATGTKLVSILTISRLQDFCR